MISQSISEMFLKIRRHLLQVLVPLNLPLMKVVIHMGRPVLSQSHNPKQVKLN
jgi:hypothetical protein